VIAKTEVCCLLISVEDFFNVRENFLLEAEEKQKVLLRLFPPLNEIVNQKYKDNLQYYFTETVLKKGEAVTRQDEPGGTLFILIRGSLAFQKRISNKANVFLRDYKNVTLFEVSIPTFVGEEILFERPEELSELGIETSSYSYTVLVTSNKAKVSCIKAQAFR